MLLTELSSPTHIHYEESNLSFLHDSPRHFNCGIQLICTDGEAVVSTGAQQFHLKKMSELIFGEEAFYNLSILRRILEFAWSCILLKYFFRQP